MSKKIIVIGGGLAGIQTAYFLNREGMDVTLVERREGPALETSYANGGLITPSHSVPWNSPGIFRTLLQSIANEKAALYVRPSAIPQYLFWGLKFIRNSTPARFQRTIERNARLASFSLRQFQEICTETGITFDGDNIGTMMVYRDQKAFEAARYHNDIVAQLGVVSQDCSAAELTRLEPALNQVADKLAGGFFFSGDQHGDAHVFANRLAEVVTDRGVKMRLGETVTGFEQSGHLISGVITNKSRLQADAVVMATALWSVKLAAKLRIGLPIKPVKGYSLTYDATGWNTAPRIPVVDDTAHIAVTPLGDRVRFVGTAEFSGYSPGLNAARLDNLRRAAIGTYPDLAEIVDGREPLNAWNGFRPMTPDCLPVIGQVGPENLYLNTGHGYLGWTTGSGTSKAVSDLIAGRTAEINLADYSLNRF